MDSEEAVADWAARIERQSALTTELSERLQRQTASAESHDGDVLVTVDHSGGLADLRVSDQAMRLPADRLAGTILATSRRAQAKLARQVADMVDTLYGPGSDTASFVTRTYSEQFPTPDEDRGEGEPR